MIWKGTKMKTRKMAVAGRFYPANPTELRNSLKNYIEQGVEVEQIGKAVVAPHAGYPYSGPIAGSAYRNLQRIAKDVRRVVLLGPSHYVPVFGVAASSADYFETPLGLVPVDHSAYEAIADLGIFYVVDEAHSREHSLEVHLPFMQTIFSDFSVVPLTVGWAEPEELFQVYERLWGEKETAVIISSDLSHFYPHLLASKMDRETADNIEGLEYLEDGQACGRVPVNGMIAFAKAKGLRVRTLDLRNSGDTAGPRTEVVGYGAFLFYTPEPESSNFSS